LAKYLDVPVPRRNDIVWELRGISADTAVRPARFIGTTEQFWLNLPSADEVGRVIAEQTAEFDRIQPGAATGSS
jgi:antitoxin HigA-1